MELVQIIAELLISKVLVPTEPLEQTGGTPYSLTLVSRLPPLHAAIISGFPFAFGPAQISEDKRQKLGVLDQQDVAVLALHIESNDFDTALTKTRSVFESIVDHLSFQLQEAIHIFSLGLVDVTPPLIVGETRAYNEVLNASAIILPKFYTNPWNSSLQVVADPVPSITPRFATEEKHHNLALWWYIKSLAVPFLVDQLLCLFTSIDQLSQPHLKGPYKTDCNHEIHCCPVCNSQILRPNLGATFRKYLTDIGGLAPEEVKELWQARQVIHGHDVFSYEQLDRLTALVAALRIVVFKGLKAALGVPSDQSPHLFHIGLDIGASLGLIGSRQIYESDLELDRCIRSANGK